MAKRVICGPGDAGVIGTEEARQIGGQERQNEANRHLIAPELDAGEADEYSDQRPDEHGGGNPDGDLQRGIEDAGLLGGPGGGRNR